MTLHLQSDDFVNQKSYSQDLEYADLSRDALHNLAADGDEGAAKWLETNPEDGGPSHRTPPARTALRALGLRWEWNPLQPREAGRWVAKGGITPEAERLAAHTAYEKAWGEQRRAALTEAVTSSRQATDHQDKTFGRLSRTVRPPQPRAQVSMAHDRLQRLGEVGQGISDGVADWSGRKLGAETVRNNPLHYRHFLSAAHEGVPTDRPLHRGLRVSPAHLAEFAKLKPGDVIPTRYAASFTEDERFANGFAKPKGEGDRAVHMVLAPGSRGLPISALQKFEEGEWVVGRDLGVDKVEPTENGLRVHVHTVEDAGTGPRPGMGDITISPKMMEDLRQSTAGPYMTEDGHFTPERQALHDEIVRQAVENVPRSDHPRLIMMGGGPAAGKTAMIESGAVKLPEQYVHIDPDVMKSKIPEVAEMKAAGDDTWAAKSHEESSYLSARVLAAAYETQRDAVMDGTGDSSLEKLNGKIDRGRQAGFRVEGNYITVDPDTAVARATARAQKTGRVVPETFIRDTHGSISRVFPQAAQKFDQLRLFDNNGAKGEAPTLVASSERQGGFTVHDHAKYNRFLGYAR